MEIEVKGHKLVIFDSPDEMPVARFHKFSKYMLIDGGLGSDISAIDKHIGRLIELNTRGMRDDIDTELRNMRQSIAMALDGFDGKVLALSVLVKSVDGKPRDDISEEGLRQTAEMFREERVDRLVQWLVGIKKKIDAELTAYFPQLFGKATDAEYASLVRKRCNAILTGIIEGRDTSAEVAKIEGDMWLFEDVKPFWNGEFEVKYDRQYEDMCLYISGELHKDAKGMTVTEYYSAYELLDKRGKEIKKIKAKKRR